MSAHPGARAGEPIGLVLTGGTIGAEQHGAALSVGAHATRAEADLLAGAWRGSDAPRVIVAEPLRKLSENLVPRDWLAIAAAVRPLVEVDGAAGVLVLHGTDTMAYTAAALSFLLADVERPIVLTGSRLPAAQESSDAPANVSAALVALRELQAGVYVVFGAGAGAGAGTGAGTGASASAGRPSHVHLAGRVRKQRGGGETFASVNRELVATVDGDRLTSVRPYDHRARERSRQEVDERVLALRLHPGLDFEAALETVVRGDVRAVVVELYASATGPDTSDRYSLPAFIRACTERATIVVTTTPGSSGTPSSAAGVYETTQAIERAGAVSLGDMTTEAATVKAMWALAQSERPQDVVELMREPIAGELATPGAR
jgi:L-asparaginase/Glu-tRNA(Gln) amidotransferase subunit D